MTIERRDVISCIAGQGNHFRENPPHGCQITRDKSRNVGRGRDRQVVGKRRSLLRRNIF